MKLNNVRSILYATTAIGLYIGLTHQSRMTHASTGFDILNDDVHSASEISLHARKDMTLENLHLILRTKESPQETLGSKIPYQEKLIDVTSHKEGLECAHLPQLNLDDDTLSQLQALSNPVLDPQDDISLLQTSSSKSDLKEMVEVAEKGEEEPNFEPFVRQNDGTLSVTNTFMDVVDANLLANHLSYSLVKGNVQIADQVLDQLNNLGWEKVGLFSALEGKYLNFADTAGLILYNKEKNIYTVVWHGTASNAEGWETNVDAQLIASSDIRDEIIKSLSDEVTSLLQTEKSWLLKN